MTDGTVDFDGDAVWVYDFSMIESREEAVIKT